MTDTQSNLKFLSTEDSESDLGVLFKKPQGLMRPKKYVCLLFDEKFKQGR